MNETTNPINMTEVYVSYGEAVDTAVQAVQKLIQKKLVDAGYSYDAEFEAEEQERTHRTANSILYTAYMRGLGQE